MTTLRTLGSDRRTARTIAVGLLVLGVMAVSVVALLQGHVLGVIGVLGGILVVDALLYRAHELGELRSVGAVEVGSIGHRLPVLPAGLTCRDVRRRGAELLADEWCLVEGPHGWLVAHSATVLETALMLDADAPMPPIGRPTRWVEPSETVDHLPRPPRDDEVWLVRQPSTPLALTRDDLIGAARR